jgi:aspartyl/asparaginyl beta-hydroxylase (cupin superfamily)
MERATTSDADQPMQGRAFLEHWAGHHGVPLSGMDRVFTAVDSWSSGGPLAVPELDGGAFYDSRAFDWVERLIELAPDLRAELAELSDRLTLHPESAALVDQGAWRTWFIWRSGREIPENAEAAPIAAEAARLVPGEGEAGNVYYSVIDPGTRIRRHTGVFNGRLRCHLGLDVPEAGCEIEIAGEHRAWANDECLVFSDFPPHSVANDSARTRAVFVVDFWHPELVPDERNALAALLTGRP